MIHGLWPESAFLFATDATVETVIDIANAIEGAGMDIDNVVPIAGRGADGGVRLYVTDDTGDRGRVEVYNNGYWYVADAWREGEFLRSAAGHWNVVPSREDGA